MDHYFSRIVILQLILILIFLVAAFVIKKTRFGLRLRACGEHPGAADSVGVNVYKIRYSGVIISGVLAGIGGLVFVVDRLPQTLMQALRDTDFWHWQY